MNFTQEMRLQEEYSTGSSVDPCIIQDLTMARENLTILQCERWQFEMESVVSEFDLVCGKKIWVSLSKSIYLFGYVVGSTASGVFSDTFGRKPVIIISTVGYLIFGSAVIISPSVIIFNILRCLTAVCAISVFNVSFIYCSEIVSGKWTSFVGILFGVTCALGLMVVPFLSSIFPTWTSLQIALTIPIIIVFAAPLMFLLFPESPRWLMAKQLFSKSESVLELISEANGRNAEIPQADNTVNEVSSVLEKVSILDLFKTPGICRSTLVLYYIWFCFITIYNCLILNTKSLMPGKMSFNIEILGGLEVLASFLILPILNYAPRRLSVSLCMICTGAAFLTSSQLENELMKQIFAQIGQFSNTLCFLIMMVFTAEIYPTAIRNMGLGTSNAVGRIGASLAPVLVSLGEGQLGALLIFGVMTLVGGFLVHLLPETLNRGLDNTIGEGEIFNEVNGGFRCSDNEEKKPILVSHLKHALFQE
jgi:OCT family organic cation transporter-like MFS transporter 4/5